MKYSGTILSGQGVTTKIGHINAHMENLREYIGFGKPVADILPDYYVTTINAVARIKTKNGGTFCHEQESVYCTVFPRKDAATFNDNIATWRMAFDLLLRDAAVAATFNASSWENNDAMESAQLACSLWDIVIEFRTNEAVARYEEYQNR